MRQPWLPRGSSIRSIRRRRVLVRTISSSSKYRNRVLRLIVSRLQMGPQPEIQESLLEEVLLLLIKMISLNPNVNLETSK